MDDSAERDVAAYFDRAAPFYDRVTLEPAPWPPNLVLAALLAGHLRPGMRALDIGAGTGQTTAALVPPLEAHDITGVDISAGMLAAYAERFSAAGTFRGTLAEYLASDHATAPDIIVSVGAFEFVADLRTVLQDCGRLLLPSGLLAISCETGVPNPAADPLRYPRAAEDIERLVREAGFVILAAHQAEAYREASMPVNFAYVLAQRP